MEQNTGSALALHFFRTVTKSIAPVALNNLTDPRKACPSRRTTGGISWWRHQAKPELNLDPGLKLPILLC